jgi:hypothetical protein
MIAFLDQLAVLLVSEERSKKRGKITPEVSGEETVESIDFR